MNNQAQIELSVIVPCLNEEGNVVGLVERILNVFSRQGINGEIILVNDGSTDRTGILIDELSTKQQRVKAIHHPYNKGITAGWQTGLNQATGIYICLIDADFQNLPEDIWRLYREIKSSYADIVQGWRSHIGRVHDIRFILSIGLNFFLNVLFSMKMRDNKSGFVVCRRDMLQNILTRRFHYRYFQTFISVAAKSKGYTLREIETLFEERRSGKSFMSAFPIRTIVDVVIDLFKAFIEYRLLTKPKDPLGNFLRYNPPSNKQETLPAWRKLYFYFYVSLMPIHHWTITSQAADDYQKMKCSQWWTPEVLRSYQEERLRALVHHAYWHVPWYRQQMDQLGIHPEDIRTLDDLTHMPILSKQDVRDNLYFDMLADNHNKREMQRTKTSGSTGEPFVCYADRRQLELRWAATQRSLEWTGYRFGDRVARLWHQTIGMSRSQIVKERLDAWFNRRLFIPAFGMNQKNLESFIQQLQKHKPVLIDGYAESLNFLAHYLKEHPTTDLKPAGLISSAQILPEQSRQIIEDAFGCKVFDKYGSREFSGIAYECDAHQGHHVVAENYIVEIIKGGQPAQPGTIGEVLITDLNNYSMPFIRYRIGDVAEALDNHLPCPCGRGLPRIGRVEGRVQAIIAGTNGTFLPGTFFAHLFKDYDHAVRQYQVVQEKLGAIQLNIVKTARFTDEVLDQILQQLHHYLGQDMQINVQFVDSIPLGRTGKHQGSISKLNFDFQTTGLDIKHFQELR